MGELLALKWEDIDFSTAQLHVRRTINRLAKYEAHDGENKTEIVFGTPKTKNSRRTIPLTHTMADELTHWKQQQAQDKIRAGDKYTDDGFIVTNEFGHYFEQKTFKDYYDRLLKDADIRRFTFHALRHTFATRALERGMDYKILSTILGHYSVAFTMDTYVHSMDEHKRREMDKMNEKPSRLRRLLEEYSLTNCGIRVMPCCNACQHTYFSGLNIKASLPKMPCGKNRRAIMQVVNGCRAFRDYPQRPCKP